MIEKISLRHETKKNIENVTEFYYYWYYGINARFVSRIFVDQI